jgi:hypothetical protein
MKPRLFISIVFILACFVVAPSAFAARLGETCSLTNVCESGLACDGGVCKSTSTGGGGAPAGFNCQITPQCQSGLTCNGSICVRSGGNLSGEGCGGGGKCASGLECAASSERCVPIKGSTGASCDQPSDCMNQAACIRGICVPPNGMPEGAICTGSIPCRQGLSCDSLSNRCTSTPTSPEEGNPANPGTPGNTTEAPGRILTIKDIYNIILGLTCWLTRIALFLIVSFIIWYGFLFMRAQGDPSKVEDAKKAFTWGIVGIIVILGTYSIIATVGQAVGGTAASISALPLDCSGF